MTTTAGVKLRDQFFLQLRSGIHADESANGAASVQFTRMLGKIADGELTDQVFPRHASKENDRRIERLVSALEETVAFADLAEATATAAALETTGNVISFS